MKPITKTRLVIGGLVAVHVVLGVCALVMEPRFLGFLREAVLMLIPTQGVLLGLWIAMGRRWAIPWRACLGIEIVAATAFAEHQFSTYPEPQLTPILVWETCLVALMLVLLRGGGLRMSCSGVPAMTRPPFQFSLLEVFSWMTATAVFLTLLQSYAPYRDLFPKPGFNSLGIGCLALLALPILWLVFGRRWFPLRCLACGTSLAATTFGIIAAYRIYVEVTGIALQLSIYTAWLIASFLVIRWAGYRLEWQWRFGRRGAASVDAGEGRA